MDVLLKKDHNYNRLVFLCTAVPTVRSAKSSTEGGGVGRSAHLVVGRGADATTAFSGLSSKLKNIAHILDSKYRQCERRDKSSHPQAPCGDCDLSSQTLYLLTVLLRLVDFF